MNVKMEKCFDVMISRHDVAPWCGVIAVRSHRLLVSKCWQVLLSPRGKLAVRPRFRATHARALY